MAKMRAYNTKSMKLNTVQVKEMYNRLKNGELTQGAAALEYGLGVIQVGRIARGESRANETGARVNPIPNFNAQQLSGDAEASLAKLRAIMDQPAAVPPGPAYPDQDSDGSGLAKLNQLAQPTALEQAVIGGLDQLEKGDSK